MKKVFLLSLFFAITITAFNSCVVAKKKFDAATKLAEQRRQENDSLRNEIANRDNIITKLNTELAQLKEFNNKQATKISVLKDSINTLESEISELNNRISTIGNENQNTKKQLSNTNAEIAEQRKKLEQLQAFIDGQQRATEALRKKIADALEGFNSNELTITRKNGKVYISMQEGLLFPSASAVVNPKGKLALSKVASVLNTNSDININIEGHTDSLPIHTKLYADNWDLSTARAISISHVLIDDYKVSPTKLVASGRSQYDPLATNSTPEGRAANRRTEIILEPKLDELMQILNGQGKK